MLLLRFMLRSAGPLAAWLVALGALAALVNGGLVAVVHRALSAPAGELRGLALAFIGLGLGKVLSARLSGGVVNTFALESMTELRREMIRKLLRVPYRHLEQVGTARVYAGLTQDVNSLGTALQSMPGVLTNAAILVGATGYLFYIDAIAALLFSLMVPAGWLVYRLLSRRAVAELELQRRELDRLHQHFGALTSGAKELKMNAARRHAFMREAVLETTESMLEHDLAGRERYLTGQAANSTLVLVMIGLALFVLPTEIGMDAGQVSGYVLTGLYLMGPLSGLLRMLPLIASARISLRHIEQLGVQLDRESGEVEEGRNAAPPLLTALELDGITMRYETREGAFTLGPLSLALEPGEVLFITGGNGSGKSTLAKILCGLYEPDDGVVRWNGDAVGRAERDRYRQLWSTVFSEFHVFDRFYGIDPENVDARASDLLETLGLSDAVDMIDGAPSTVQLSRGQRKRLALLTAMLEDRPAYLFDEWAADQDPHFKERFYTELVPRLKARGKTVVVVTHDDRYFDGADRVLKMDGGKPVA